MRYQYKPTMINANPLYREHFKNRGVRFITQHRTPDLSYPTPRELAQLETIGHVWKVGDRFYKLAYKHYGDSELWWIIAFFNRTPTESHVKLGAMIEIPFPLEKIIDFIGY